MTSKYLFPKPQLYNVRGNRLIEAMRRHVIMLDGATGTMLRRRGIAGLPDSAAVNSPSAVADLHKDYLTAGADIITTDTFNSNEVDLALDRFRLRPASVISAAVKIARDEVARSAGQHWVAGSVGPSSVVPSACKSDPDKARRLADAILIQIKLLLNAGIDLLSLETIYDSSSGNMMFRMATQAMKETGVHVPVMMLFTPSREGRLVSGETVAEFLAKMSMWTPLIVGFNCGFGAKATVAAVDSLDGLPCAIAVYPNAGLPDADGNYLETPDEFAETLRPLMEARRINIVGGCCGTTPDHIASLKRVAKGCRPRPFGGFANFPAPDL